MVRFLELKGFYELERTIGCGGFAKVKLATHLATGEKVAIKIMDKALLGADLSRVKLEISALKSLCHDNICKLYEVIETETHIFLVMEYCSGGELFDHIVEKNRLTETESRTFFRQIVSAVAYLHSIGYAHRDLKPENILLDKHQNLKLIDFGLCAKPAGGMENPLFTSCGSPTYAAPELVQGKQYLGTEVDVWAMGVLLYALLVGALPFDDVNIDSLYKKILIGKYPEPSFLSSESLQLIRSMLQVDPKKRITIQEMLSHKWITFGILEPVQYFPRNNKNYQRDCIDVMASHYNVESRKIWQHLKKWKYDYSTSTYLLLVAKKKRGSSLKLNNLLVKVPVEKDEGCVLRRKPALRSNNVTVIPKKIDGDLKRILEEVTPKKAHSGVNAKFVTPPKPPSIRKPFKRIRSPGPEDNSPVPPKKISIGPATPTQPVDKKIASSVETPSSARRVLGTIERSFHKVVNVLTPRKLEETISGRPSLLTSKELFNVSTTQCRDPEFVMIELSKALEKKGVACKRKGFTLRGKLEPNANKNLGECSFELEICLIPDIHQLPQTNTPSKSILKKGMGNTPVKNSKGLDNFVGIRRKRLRGDAWCYKKVCEEILALTSKEFVFTESSV
ncbi:unnamed protein product [Phyllotreta striolata]|uniref:non-specific serine/threonine protein kinase n=1 Tax=Phyllotreta striolata TaxID=444603 RepID=A0A9N9XNC9_PHYSR|nr:unnamed protein product [Phyllotreta striolata]